MFCYKILFLSFIPFNLRANVNTDRTPSLICRTLRGACFPACRWQFNTYQFFICCLFLSLLSLLLLSSSLEWKRKAVNNVRSLCTAGATNSHWSLFQNCGRIRIRTPQNLVTIWQNQCRRKSIQPTVAGRKRPFLKSSLSNPKSYIKLKSSSKVLDDTSWKHTIVGSNSKHNQKKKKKEKKKKKKKFKQPMNVDVGRLKYMRTKTVTSKKSFHGMVSV